MPRLGHPGAACSRLQAGACSLASRKNLLSLALAHCLLLRTACFLKETTLPGTLFVPRRSLAPAPSRGLSAFSSRLPRCCLFPAVFAGSPPYHVGSPSSSLGCLITPESDLGPDLSLLRRLVDMSRGMLTGTPGQTQLSTVPSDRPLLSWPLVSVNGASSALARESTASASLAFPSRSLHTQPSARSLCSTWERSSVSAFPTPLRRHRAAHLAPQ